MTIPGWATEEGTALFQAKAALPSCAVHEVHSLRLSALGMGTYMGNMDHITDRQQEDALVHLLRLGCNVIDCAPNYRNGRSELSVGRALKRAIGQGIAEREAVFVATKVGLVPENRALPAPFTAGPEHSCYAPPWLRRSLRASLRRLNLETADCVFVHNLELLRLTDTAHFEQNFIAVAECMEDMVRDGMTRAWGISSWNGFRVPENHPEYLSLDRLRARSWPHLRYLQLPLGLWGSEAVTGTWQGGESILDHARDLAVFASSPLLQGELAAALGNSSDSIEKAVLFVRDTANVAVTLLGIKQKAHVEAWNRMQHVSYDTLMTLYEFF